MKTKKATRINSALFVTLLFLLSSILLPATFAEDNIHYSQGYEKGVSWSPVIPIKKATLINHDEESYLDDYAYLAAIPTSVFNDDETLYSHPLLFYQDSENTSDIKEITLDARPGIDYFMEDWLSYCNDELDELITINVPIEKTSQWSAKNSIEIDGETPFDIAKRIALHDWSYSDNAVIAVIDDEIEKAGYSVSNKLESTLLTSNIYEIPTININQKNCLDPEFRSFEVGDRYKFVDAVVWWDGIIVGGLMIPTSDPDIQLYCKNDEGWMQTSAASNYNIMTGPTGYEQTQSYVYKPGTWKVGITDFPTKSSIPTKEIGNIFEIQGSLIKTLLPKVTYHVDITLYSGIDIELPDAPQFGCKSANFTLTWNNPKANLGFTLIGPSGEAIFTSINTSSTESQEIHLDSLGECLPGESYSVCVFSTKKISDSVDFQIEYNFEQEISESERDSLTSASEGAVLASILNAPLLYTNPSSLSGPTKEVLKKLGVKNVYLVDIGNKASQKVREEIQKISDIKAIYKEIKQIYDKIRDITGSNDVIFTTIDPWSYWLFGERKFAGEKEGALFIGPATYIAAHHGSPVIILENHPRLSSAATYHNEFWRRFSDKRVRNIPSSAEMILTGKRIYDFLKDYDFDKDGLESIITVADQFDIGISWDRIFPGKANPGRFWGSPVDISYWIARSVFYPALIYENPAMQDTVTLINGSVSQRLTEPERDPLLEVIFEKGNLVTLNLGVGKLIRESAEEEYRFPVLCSFLSYNHRFNERASEYYGAEYQCANGMTPGEDSTMEPIDQGVAKKYTGNTGTVFPDITTSEVIPFYLDKGGYSTAFSTSLDAVRNNLNQGVIMWIHSSHGSAGNGGSTMFWDPLTGFQKQADNGKIMAKLALFRINHPGFSKFIGGVNPQKIGGILRSLPGRIGTLFDILRCSRTFIAVPLALQEDNPWRAYEWYLGSTEEPDTMSSDLKGILPFTSINLPFFPATGMTWVSARKPLRELLNNLILRKDPSRPFNVDNLYDGVVGISDYSTWQLQNANSIEIEESLENLHSMAFFTNVCLTSNTYLHLMMIRHGSVCQIQDPWVTSWYSDVWLQSIPRDIALGYTVGEAYTRGISKVASLYISDSPSWWWDQLENVVYFGDPDLRLFVPGTEFSDKNNWEKPKSLRYDEDLSISGHTPFGTTYYPHEITQDLRFIVFLLLATIIIICLIIMITLIIKRKRGN